MTRIFALLFAIALTLSCSTLNPILKPIGNCAGKTVAASDANEALNDLLTQNWTDLAAEGVRIGFDMLDCIISDITTQAPGLKPAATEFKTLHAVEFRAAGVSACNSLRGGPAAGQEPHKLYQLGSTPSPATRAGSTPAGWPTLGSKGAVQNREVALVRLGQFSMPSPGIGSRSVAGGGTHRLTLASCDTACGTPRSSLVVEDGSACSCWRASKTDWRQSRWVRL